MVPFIGSVVELVDTPDLGSGAARRGGSTPFRPTNFYSGMAERLNAAVSKAVGLR